MAAGKTSRKRTMSEKVRSALVPLAKGHLFPENRVGSGPAHNLFDSMGEKKGTAKSARERKSEKRPVCSKKCTEFRARSIEFPQP